MKAVIHQPIYLPYPGLFHKISMADIFIIMDNTQYDKRHTNRNRIIDPNRNDKWNWISVPIIKDDKFLQNKYVRINNQLEWREENWKKISHVYAKSKFFESYGSYLRDIFDKHWDFLFELDFHLIKKILEWLNLKVNIVKESELNVKGNASEKLVEICKSVNADSYISGIGGFNYINKEVFDKNNIDIIFQKYKPVPYKQRFSENFIPDLSIIDLLFNLGPETKKFVSEEFLQYHNN